MRRDYQWWREQVVGTGDQAIAERRVVTTAQAVPADIKEHAIAGDSIAEEANAARLKALLEAAREQDNQKSTSDTEDRSEGIQDDREPVGENPLSQNEATDPAVPPAEAPSTIELIPDVEREPRRVSSPAKRSMTVGIAGATLLGVGVGFSGYLIVEGRVPDPIVEPEPAAMVSPIQSEQVESVKPESIPQQNNLPPTLRVPSVPDGPPMEKIVAPPPDENSPRPELDMSTATVLETDNGNRLVAGPEGVTVLEEVAASESVLTPESVVAPESVDEHAIEVDGNSGEYTQEPPTPLRKNTVDRKTTRAASKNKISLETRWKWGRSAPAVPSPNPRRVEPAPQVMKPRPPVEPRWVWDEAE